VVAPGEFAVQVESEIFDVICTGNLFVVHVDRRAFFCSSGEGNVNGLECVGLHAPMKEPGLK
jgi:hypothetical protein